MTTHPTSPTWASIRQMIRRYGWWLALGLLLVAGGLTSYQFTSASAAATPAANSAQAPAPDPTTQSVLAYLRAHSGEQVAPTPAAPLDPAQQGVIGYVRAHDRAEQSRTLWDQVTQAVFDYLRAHS
jgi:hypothetical protein